jgi:hypothetical protein
VQIVRRLLHPRSEAQALGLLAKPDAAVLGAADPAEVVGAETEDRAVVQHPAGLVAHRGVDDLAVGESTDVARDGRLEEGLGVGPEHLELPERREVHDRGALAARPVLVDRAVVVVGRRQPVAVVLREARGEGRRARLEARLPRQPRLRVGRDAVRDRRREPLLCRIDPYVDLRRVPAVRGVDVVRAGAREAHEVGRSAQEHVVAGARPRLVEEVRVLRVERRVVEEVDRRPAAPGLDRVGLELGVEVVRAVDVAEVAHVLVVLRRAGQPECVVATHGVADDFHERLEVVVEELRVEARLRVRAAHQRAGRGRVEPALLAGLQLPGVERQEVGALPALDVDDLDVLAGPHLVGERRGAIDLEVEPRLGERLRQPGLELVVRSRPGDLELEVGGGHAAVDDLRVAAWRPDDDEERPLRTERRLRAGRRRGPEEDRGPGGRRVHSTRRDRVDDRCCAVHIRPDERAEDRRGAVG